jgi:hypothetical protein
MLGAVRIRTVCDADGIGEPGVAQQALPRVLGNAGLVRSDVVVEQPPALQQPEDQGHEQPGARQLHDDEHSARAEQLLEPVERPAQVRRRVQHVRGDDHVERMRVEALLERIALDIERPGLRERKAGELVLRMRGEAGRDVGEHVFGAMLRQSGKHEAGHAPGSAADLQNPQRPAFRQTPADLGERLLHEKIVEAEAR